MKTLIRILSRLPMSALYALSDGVLYPLMYHVVRYRRALVRENLRGAFPAKSERERRAIEKRFYHHFADVIMEIVHGYRATDEDMRERMQFDNLKDVEQWAVQNQGVIFMLGHLGNWEWTADVQKRFSNPAIRHYNVYRRLKNKSADDAMIALREKRSGKDSNFEKNSLLRHLVRVHRLGTPFTLGLISDQKVSPDKPSVETVFFGRSTTFLDGGENIARKFGYAVTYVHITQLSRGHYSAHVELIADNPADIEPGVITRKYAKRLEANIMEQPELWLWTHNRWKYSRPLTDADK